MILWLPCFLLLVFDVKEQIWKPLTKKETEKDEYKQYGLLFHCPLFQKKLYSDYRSVNEKEESLNHNAILPIGFQPFMRCHMQYGYGIKMENEFPLQHDAIFEKLRFRHNEILSKQVYKKMKGRDLIYPHEGLSRFSDIIEKIKNSTLFSEEAFICAFNQSPYFKDQDSCRRIIQNSNILGKNMKIGRDEHPFALSRQRKRSFDRKYENFSIEKEYGIKLVKRCVL